MAGLEHRVVAITGGASGIGRATALSVAKAGGRVGIIDLNEDAVEGVVQEIKSLGGRGVGVAADVADEAAIEAAADRFEREFGPVSGLIASAGIGAVSPAETHSVADWERVMRVNATGVFVCAKAFGRRMIERREGSIVGIGSIDGMGGQAGRIAYSASKWAVHGLLKGLAMEWGRYNVRVNGIAPTLVDTPMLRNSLPAYFVEEIVNRTPMARIAKADDIAAAAIMLLDDAFGFVTGAIVPVDGGLTTGYLTLDHGGDFQSMRLLAEGVYASDRSVSRQEPGQ